MIKLFVISVVLVVCANPAFSSRVYPQTYEELVSEISTVCIVKVNRVENEERFYQFKDGSKHLQSKATIVYGDVIKSLFGSCNKDKVVSRFVTRSTSQYLADDQKVFISLLRPGSGHEHSVEQGKEYIFSYTDFQMDESEEIERRHLRMDALKDRSKILKLLNEKAVND